MAEQPTLQSTPQQHQAAKMPELAFDENRVNGDTTTSTERYRSNSDPVEVVPRRRKNSTQSTSSSDSDSSGILRRKNRSLINGNGHNNNEGEVHPHDDDCLVRRRSASVLEVKEHAQDRLRDELLKAQSELMLKDEECKKLEHVRDQMCEELEELTAKLFEEANKMVQDANIKRMNSEKLLKDANSQNEILQAEVTALKSLVLTSTPSTPNRHLHPQIDTRPPTGQSGNGGNSKKSSTLASFVKGHRRSTSHHNFAKEMRAVDIDLSKPVQTGNSSNDNREIDPVVFEEFRAWRATKTLDPESQFLSHVIREDISPCFSLSNKQLSQSVFNCVKNNTITIEPVSEKNLVPTKCALTQTSTICPYQIRLGINNEPFHNISQLARNRITAVCDFYTYARYITQGLVKSDDGEVYWEVVRLRKQMALARLGLTS